MAEQTEQTTETKGRGRPKTRVGIVTSNKMSKTVVVTVQRRTAHPKYGKIVNRRERYKAHAEEHEFPAKVTLHEGDQVRIAETRPMSRDKRWRVVEILRKSPGV